MSQADELQKLQQLRESGAINDEEFARAKENLLNPPPGGLGSMFGAGGDAQQARTWAMFLHLSQFAGYIIPFAGLILPLVLWQVKKNEFPEIDVHGKIVANWIISEILYAIGCFLLIFVLIGFPLLMVLFALAIIFPIVGGIKASSGEAWKYPLSIPFFK